MQVVAAIIEEGEAIPLLDICRHLDENIIYPIARGKDILIKLFKIRRGQSVMGSLTLATEETGTGWNEERVAENDKLFEVADTMSDVDSNATYDPMI